MRVDRFSIAQRRQLAVSEADVVAIDDIICAVLRKDHPLPAGLLDELREWLADGPFDAGDNHPDELARRVARVRAA